MITLSGINQMRMGSLLTLVPLKASSSSYLGKSFTFGLLVRQAGLLKKKFILNSDSERM